MKTFRVYYYEWYRGERTPEVKGYNFIMAMNGIKGSDFVYKIEEV